MWFFFLSRSMLFRGWLRRNQKEPVFFGGSAPLEDAHISNLRAQAGLPVVGFPFTAQKVMFQQGKHGESRANHKRTHMTKNKDNMPDGSSVGLFVLILWAFGWMDGKQEWLKSSPLSRWYQRGTNYLNPPLPVQNGVDLFRRQKAWKAGFNWCLVAQVWR